MSFWKKAVELAKEAAQEAAKDMQSSMADTSNRLKGVENEYEKPSIGTLEYFVFDKITKFNDGSNIYSGVGLQGERVQRKIQNVLNGYASDATGKILVLLDNTSFGTADYGLCLTEKEFFYKMRILDDGRDSFSIKLEDIYKVDARDADDDYPYIKINKTELPFNHDIRRFMKALVACLDEYIKERRAKTQS